MNLEIFLNVAEKVNGYHQKINNFGFQCSSVEEKYIFENFEKNDVDFHKKYLCEFAKESILNQNPEKILFDDSYVCNSNFLQSLKNQRFLNYGDVDSILSNVKYDHNIEISPVIRQVRIEKNTNEKKFIDLFLRCRQSEIERHKNKISQMYSMFLNAYSSGCIQRMFSDIIADKLYDKGFKASKIKMMYEDANIVYLKNGDKIFIIYPSVTADDKFDGHLSLGARIASEKVLSGCEFDKSNFLKVNLSYLLPKRFIDYNKFSNFYELSLNMIAHACAAEVISCDVSSLLNAQK